MADASAASECVELVNRVLKKLSRRQRVRDRRQRRRGRVSAQIYGQPVVSKTAATFADAHDEAASALLPVTASTCQGCSRPPPRRRRRRGAGDRAGRLARAAAGVAALEPIRQRAHPAAAAAWGAHRRRRGGCRSGRRVARAATASALDAIRQRSRDSCRRPVPTVAPAAASAPAPAPEPAAPEWADDTAPARPAAAPAPAPAPAGRTGRRRRGRTGAAAAR